MQIFDVFSKFFCKKTAFCLLISKKSSTFAHKLLKCGYERIIER